MFSAVPMQRLSVVVLERDERTVLRGLGSLGAVHLVRSEAGPETAPQAPPDRTEDLRRTDALLSRVDKLVRDVELAHLPEVRADLSLVGLDDVDKALAPLEAQAGQVLQSRAAALQRWARVTTLLEQVEAYEGLDLSLEQVGRFSFLHFAIGSLPEEQFEAFESKVGPNVVLVPLGEEGGRWRLVAATSRKGRFALETALASAGFRREAIPDSAGGTMKQILAEARREKEQLGRDLARPREAMEALRRELAEPLARLRAAALVERRILEAEQNFPHTDATVLITGWIPKADVPNVRRRLQDLVGGRCVVEAEDPRDVPEDQIPVLLRHPRLLRPFEMLVAGYGLPGYRELEPTLFVAITFLVMFGIMFGDVGHGGVLALAGLGMLTASRREKIRDVGMLLALGGTSSLVFGVIYGSYFGYQRWALWRDPLGAGENPIEFLLAAIPVGVVIISLGLILNIINRFRRGDIVGGFLDKFGVVGALFYWGVLALGLKYLAFRQGEHPWMDVVLFVVIPLALVGLVLKSPIQYALARRSARAEPQSSWGETLLESVIEAYEAVLSYMTNTISFLRLAAYAMIHAAVLMATFILAAELKKAAGGGVPGNALGLVILVLGNAVAILLEGLIVSVQAIRLQYYEFFSKFFGGGGHPFQPFCFPSEDKTRAEH